MLIFYCWLKCSITQFCQDGWCCFSSLAYLYWFAVFISQLLRVRIEEWIVIVNLLIQFCHTHLQLLWEPNAGYNIWNLFSGLMSINSMLHLAYSHHANSYIINIFMKGKLKMYNKIRFFYLLGCLHYPRIKKFWGSENHFVNVT